MASSRDDTPSPAGTAVPVGGHADPAFGTVADVFAANFAPSGGDTPDSVYDPGDLGAALCVIVDGRIVVDVWGGWCDVDRTRRWEADTLVNAYSVGKAVTAAAVLTVVAAGALDLDAPLSRVWPEYGAHGKGTTTLREALSHRAGLPAVRRALGTDEIFDFATVADALAESEPWWPPGAAHGYHVNTLGHLAGEPVRRATGRSVGEVIRSGLAGPLGAELWIGLPRTEHHRVAEIDFVQDLPLSRLPHQGPGHLDRMRYAAYFNPPGLSGIGTVNTERWREAQVPSTNLHATARGVARLFAALAGAPERSGLAPGAGEVVPAALVAEAATTQSRGHDLVLDRDSRFGLGMMLHREGRAIGVGEASFGHFGNGGSLGFADPEARLGFGYLINRPGDRWQVPRTRRLLAALREALGAAQEAPGPAAG